MGAPYTLGLGSMNGGTAEASPIEYFIHFDPSSLPVTSLTVACGRRRKRPRRAYSVIAYNENYGKTEAPGNTIFKWECARLVETTYSYARLVKSITETQLPSINTHQSRKFLLAGHIPIFRIFILKNRNMHCLTV